VAKDLLEGTCGVAGFDDGAPGLLRAEVAGWREIGFAKLGVGPKVLEAEGGTGSSTFIASPPKVELVRDEPGWPSRASAWAWSCKGNVRGVALPEIENLQPT
jgi:hypothetical protein